MTGSDYWLDRATWSAYLAFLMLAGVALLITLPNNQRVAEASSSHFASSVLFPSLFAILYGILAMALGQAEIEWWRGRLSWAGHLLHLLSRQLLALGLTLPYWLTFIMAYSLAPLVLVGALAHLLVYGYVLSLFGCRLAVSNRSELFQFNLKYLIYAGYLIGSFFVPGLRYLNPFWPLNELLGSNVVAEAGRVNFFLASYILWVAVGILLALWIKRGLSREGRADGVEIS